MEMLNSDTLLLRRFVEQRDEAAFAELVRHNLPLVYRCACRLLSGDATRAEDVAQEVFADLARKARSLTGHPALAAWLHTTTRYAAARVRRGEERRRQRHEEVDRMKQFEEAGAAEPRWDRLQPVIDEALAGLKAPDREAVLLRFFAEESYLEVGRRLGLSQDAARMRVDRAVEKLRAQLVRRGVGSTAAALSLALSGQGALAVPAGLAASVTQGALASAGTVGVIGLLTAWLGTGVGKLVALGSLAGAAAVGGIYLVAGSHGTAGRETPATLAANTIAGANPTPAADPWPALLAGWDQAGAQSRTRLLLAVPSDELGQRLLKLWREDTLASRARFGAIFDRWCEAAPEPAARWAVTTWDEITGEDGVKLREQAGLAWAARAMKPAYAWALALRDAGEEAGLAARMLRQLARTEPQTAISLAKETSDAFYETARFGILEGWYSLDSADAFATLGDECLRHKGLKSLLAQWADADLKGFMNWSRGWQTAPDKTGQERLMSRLLPSRDALERANNPRKFVPALFAGYFRDLPADQFSWEGRTWCSRLFTQWRDADADAAVKWLLSLTTEAPGTQEFISMWGDCLQGDGAGGKIHATRIDTLRQLPDSPARNKALQSQVREWTKQDLEGSLAWVRGTSDQYLMGLAYQAAIFCVAPDASDQAVALYASLPEGPEKQTAALELSSVWAGTDPEAAMRWLDGVQPGWPQAALEHAEPARTPLAQWAAARPSDYVGWLVTQTRDDMQGLRNVLLISTHLLAERTNEAAAKAAALQAAYRARKSPAELQAAAVAWMKTAKDQSERDKIAGAVLRSELFMGAEKGQVLRAWMD